jgi:RNA polymerase sigma-70 factor, ECF subfamily
MASVVARLPSDPEEMALAALDRGDVREAITILMQEYGDELYRHCRQVLGDADLADDVHQTVFVEAYRDLGAFARRSSLRTWLFGIARHRCLDALRLFARVRRRFVRAEPLPERADARPDPAELVSQSKRAAALEGALARLPAKVRIAVLLRYREGLSFEEIAAMSGERAPTVQARVARALPRLRRALGEEAGP